MFSISYSVAIALNHGFLKIEDLERKLSDNDIQVFSSIIEIEADEEMDDKYPTERGCILELETVSGDKVVYKTNLPKGEPDTKLTENEYLAKFRNITSEYVEKDFVDDLYNLVMGTSNDQSIFNDIKEIFNNKCIR